MPVIKIHHKEYEINCAPGEEKRLQELANMLNKRLKENSTKFGSVNEGLLMVLTALLLEDQLEEQEKSHQEELQSIINRLEKFLQPDSK